MNTKMLAKVVRTFVCTVLSFLLVFGNISYSGEKFARADIASGLIGHWKFDDEANPGEDSSGRNYNGTLTDAKPGNADGDTPPVWGQDEAGNGILALDGVDDYVDLGDVDEYEFGPEDAFTLSLWVKPASFKRVFIIGRTNDDFNNAINHTWGLKVDHRGLLYFFLGDGTNYNYADIGWKQKADTWYHLAVVVGSQGETIDMYLNGEGKSVGHFKRTLGQLRQTDYTFKIGGELNTPYNADYLDGSMDDVRIYNRELLPEEIASLNSLLNKAPTAYNQEITMVRNTSTPVILNVNDSNKDDTLTYVIVTPPSNGTLSGTAPNLVYTPNSGFTGQDSITFKANDGHLDSNEATVSITVNMPAFPGAEGFGAAATGGRFGKVVHVTNLKDYHPYPINEEPIPGSLRWAFEKETGPRIIVFDTGGTIKLKTGLPGHHNRNPIDDITVAGQTAPGTITLEGASVIGGSNFILRHIRTRGTSEANRKSVGLCFASKNNFIIDHVSAEGASDQTVTIANCSDFTIQWSTVEESAGWGQGGGEHGEGSKYKGLHIDAVRGSKLSVHHTLIANHADRVPIIKGVAEGAIADYRNSVSNGYSHFSSTGYDGPHPEGGHFNIVNNSWVSSEGTIGKVYHISGVSDNLYPRDFEGNLWYRGPGITEPVLKALSPWSAFNYVDEPWPVAPVTTESAEDSFQSVLNKAGAWPRDATTKRTIQEVREYKGAQVGLRGPYEHFPEKQGPCSEEFDTDRDGMPDNWETAHGLNPGDSEDRNNIVPASVSERHAGYTYVEYYLNELADNIVGVSGKTHTIQANASPSDAGSAIVEHGIYDQERYFGGHDTNGGYNVPYWYGLIPFGTAEYNEGSMVMMKAKPKPGYKFSHWSGGPVEELTSTQINFPATEDVTVTANFVPVTSYNINVSISPENSGNVAGKGSYEEGDVVTLAAYSNNGYKFKRWVGGPLDGVTNPIIQFLASQDYSITAEFETGEGGDLLIDDFNDQDLDSYLIAADGQPKKWSVGSFYEITPGNYGLNNPDNYGNGGIDFGSRDYQIANREVEIPQGSTVLKFKVYNFGDQEARIDESEKTAYQGSVWNRIYFYLEREGKGWGYYSPSLLMFYTSPLRFPIIEPNSSAIVEIPLHLIRPRNLTRRADPALDKLEGFSLWGIAGRNMWGYTRWDDAKIIIDDIAFGRSGVDEATLPNLSPQANAGRDQTTRDCDGDGKETVLLNGLKSCDGDAGLITGWSWKESDTEIATGFAPSVELGVGAHEIMLSVTDEDGATSSDTVTITVLEQGKVPPLPPRLEGDVNGDGKVDIRDLLIVARAFGSVPGDSSWDARADLHENGVINIRDLLIVARNFGRNL